jgi:uncharacterized protein (DUF305 family)
MRRILLALVAAIVLAACSQGGQEQGSAPATPAPNDADVTFAQNMIPHHQQAIDMAELVDTHTERSELRQLANSIVTSQGQEITQLQGWLRSWDKPVTPEGMGHGGMEMPGTMSEADMNRLMDLQDAEFDLAFVEMMAAHHQGAIDMAKTELKDGSLPEVKQFAQKVIDDQQKEVDQLKQWEKEWSALPNPVTGMGRRTLPCKWRPPPTPHEVGSCPDGGATRGRGDR